MKTQSRFIILTILVFTLYPVSVQGACTVSTTGVNFGAYSPLGSINMDSTGTITVACTVYSNVQLTIGSSINSGGFNPRKMKQAAGSDLLNYNIYTTSSYTTIWGDGTSGTSTLSQYVRKQSPWNATVYGRIPAAQDVYVGTYGESLVVTINY